MKMKKTLIFCLLVLSVSATLSQEQGLRLHLQKLMGGEAMTEEKLGNLTVISLKMPVRNDLLGVIYSREYFAVQSRDTSLSPKDQAREIKKILKRSARFAARHSIFGGDNFFYDEKIVTVPAKQLEDNFPVPRFPGKKR